MSKLLSMVDFIMHHSENAPLEDYNQVNETFVNKVIAYANFLKQPLQLSMFVPCDDEGNIMIKSEHLFMNIFSGNWKQAKEKVLFEGFEFKKPEKEKYFEVMNRDINIVITDNILKNNKTEFLVNLNLTLTQSAKKQIGL